MYHRRMAPMSVHALPPRLALPLVITNISAAVAKAVYFVPTRRGRDCAHRRMAPTRIRAPPPAVRCVSGQSIDPTVGNAVGTTAECDRLRCRAKRAHRRVAPTSIRGPPPAVRRD